MEAAGDIPYDVGVGHRTFKEQLYPQFARIAQAMASDRRMELLDLLAQGPRHVEALATETEMSVANVSQHLQTLRAAHLVEARREGTKVIYRLAGQDVLKLWLSLRQVAASRLAEVAALRSEYSLEEATGFDVPFADLERWISEQGALVVDVRPAHEYLSGHLPGAISVPPDDLPAQLNELPRDRPIVAYCRGEYCLFADEAVALLRRNGFEAWRLDGGWSEWAGAGRKAEVSG